MKNKSKPEVFFIILQTIIFLGVHLGSSVSVRDYFTSLLFKILLRSSLVAEGPCEAENRWQLCLQFLPIIHTAEVMASVGGQSDDNGATEC